MSTTAAMAALSSDAAPATPDPDQEIIDQIIYLASLASNRREIEPMMDSLRSVTATREANQPLTDQERDKLAKLRANLVDYLIKSDPLRSFTVDTLNQRVQSRYSTQKSGMSRNTRAFFGIVLAAVGAGLLAMLPVYGSSIAYRAVVAVPLFYTVLCAGTAWFYLSSLSNFRPELRQAFVLLCAGVALLGLNFSTYGPASLLGFNHDPLFRYGGPMWIVVSMFICMYFGLWIYARMMRLRTRFASLKLLLAVMVPLIVIIVLAPHPSPTPEEAYFDFSLSCIVGFIVLGAFAAGLARAIKNSVTTAFTDSMRWLYIFFLSCVGGSILGLGAVFVLGELSGQSLNVVLALVGSQPVILLLYTGYLFKRDTGK